VQDAKLFRSWCRWLRRHFPIRCERLRITLGVPAAYPTHQLGGCHWEQDARDYPTKIDIYVRPTLSVTQTADVLAHEYAHAYRSQIPHVGKVSDEDELHALIERLIGNKWDSLRSTSDGES